MENKIYTFKKRKEEIRKDIEWYNWYYKVSDLWNIIWWGKKMKITTWFPYKYVSLTINKKQIKCSIHRLVAKAFIENIENKKEVNHKDWNKQNNKIDNLEWCTHKENINHYHKFIKIK